MGDIRRIGELHILQARAKALRLFAFSTSVYPAEWDGPYIEAATADLLDFAYHARRVSQICEIDGSTFKHVDALPVQVSMNDPGSWVTNYDWALNRLMHARSFTFGSTHADHRQLFPQATANLIPTYIRVETDQRKMATISLFGVSFCFLNDVISAVRHREPSWQF